MIIKNPNQIIIYDNAREKLEDEIASYNYIAYVGCINDYPQDIIDAHFHDEIEIFLLESGKVEVEIEKNKYVLESGDGCLIQSDAMHRFATLEGNAKFRSFVFSPSFVSGIPGESIDLKYMQPFLHSIQCCIFYQNSDFQNHFNKAFELCNNEEFGYELTLRYLLGLVVILSLQHGHKYQKQDFSHKSIKPILIWMSQHIEDEISVEDIAKQFHISTRELQRLFKQTIHLSPMTYLRKQRIQRACQILLSSDMSMTEIANLLHFSSSSHFAQVFKTMMGVTPLQYRKNNKDE